MKHARPTIFLFDIDGTILLTGGAGRRSFEHAFRSITGRPDAVNGFTFAGMTDRAIARLGLEALEREVDDALITALVDAYLSQLAIELREPRGYTVLEGVREVVHNLVPLRHAAVGLGTGNVREGARIKLAYADLWTPFRFGGFGCDHEDRTELLRRGAERGAQQLATPLADCRVVVIGDTVRDVRAAHGIGAECLAVCTGGGKEQELRDAGAACVFTNLSQSGAEDWLRG